MTHRIILTTTSSLEGFEIEQYLGIVSAQFVLGTGLLTDFLSSWTDLFGARSGSYQSKLDRIGREALDRVNARAQALGANAVVGLRVDHDEIAGGGKSMLMVTASGTAVRATRMTRSAETPLNGQSAISGEELSLLYKKDSLLARLQEGQRELTEDEWSFLTEHQVSEAADFVLKNVEYTATNIYSELPGVRSKALAYFLALPADEAKPHLYRAATSESNSTALAREAIIKSRLLDTGRITASLLNSSPTERMAALQLVQAHMPAYNLDDADSLFTLAELVDRTFSEVPSSEEKTGFMGRGVRRIWQCQCGAKNDEETKACHSCGRDRFGFPRGWLNPADAVVLLMWRASALRRQLRNEPSSA